MSYNNKRSFFSRVLRRYRFRRDVHMSNVLPNYDMSNVLPDYDMSNVLPDYDTSNVLPDYDTSNVVGVSWKTENTY
jgi:hypothetical protein